MPSAAALAGAPGEAGARQPRPASPRGGVFLCAPRTAARKPHFEAAPPVQVALRTAMVRNAARIQRSASVLTRK